MPPEAMTEKWSPTFSVVIPSYNRVSLLDRALASATDFCSRIGSAEIIVVDDCSTDGTVMHLHKRYQAEMASGRFKLVSRVTNGGVTAAKNDGARVASGTWLIFLDSDDEFSKDAAETILHTTNVCLDATAIFFRCIHADGTLVGEKHAERRMDIRSMLRHGTPGECLPVIQRTKFLACPYDEDLRGFEALAYYRILRRFGPAILTQLVARIYHTEGEDRLSLRSALRRRACLLARGNWRVLREFAFDAGLKRSVLIAVRVAYYSLLCITTAVSKLLRRANAAKTG